MKFKRIVSLFLAVFTFVGVFAFGLAVPADASVSQSSSGLVKGDDYEQKLVDAINKAFSDPQQQLDAGVDENGKATDPYMILTHRLYGYELYCNPYTGEVAYKNTLTGQILTTNPINISGLGDSTKAKLLSQLEVKFTDSTGTAKYMYSYTEAASRDQIVVKNIHNGLRVEYTMGRMDTSYLLPGQIDKNRFEQCIKAPIEEYLAELQSAGEDDAYDEVYFQYRKLLAYFTLMDPNDPLNNEATIESMQKQFPYTKKTTGRIIYKDEKGNIVEEGQGTPTEELCALYTCSAVTDKEKRLLEGYIKEFCPDYTEDDVVYDHDLVGYVEEASETPVFRMAIEYTLEEDGLSIRLPANGIRFDESKYTLTYVRMLQFFGAGDLNHSDGYVFYPDGSGALLNFRDYYSPNDASRRISVELSGNVYGDDYAYYNISNAKHQETIRMPVFGVVDPVTSIKQVTQDDGTVATVKTTTSSGFLAILEEGASLAQIATSFGASTHNFASVFATFFPRPTDTYKMSEVISVGDNKDWTVVSDKKYTGSYVLKIVMLTDKTIGNELVADGKLSGYYETSYVGMAKAYQNYLIRNAIISALTAEDVKEQLPLYLEAYGSFKTIKKILSMPITVDAPLTTFEDISKMYDELSDSYLVVQDIFDTDNDGDTIETIKVPNTAENETKYAGHIKAKNSGITNINFRLTGFANGGLESTYPAKLKWVRALGGGHGFDRLLEDAANRQFGVYPDFDFLYISKTKIFDGVSLRRDATKAVDDRYSSKQFYDPVYQIFVSYFDLVVTPTSVTKFATRMTDIYNNENAQGISVSTMGSDLNSDFNTDHLYNRDDAQSFYQEAFEALQKKYGSVMTNGGNAYTLKYADHILDAPIDSSKFKYNSRTVPFFGMVLHGFVNYAGDPINESGDNQYQLLKSIESGAALYYILSYEDDNIIKLKDDEKLSEHYSIRYSIWRDSLIKQYTELNAAIGDLQDWNIVDHMFLVSERIPGKEEQEADAKTLLTAIRTALESSYQSALTSVYRSVNIRLYTVMALKAGITDTAAVETEVSYMLGNRLSETDQALIASILAEYAAAGTVDGMDDTVGKTVYVKIDRAGVIASLEATLGSKLTEAQLAAVDAFIAEKAATGDYAGSMDAVDLNYTKQETDSDSTNASDYVSTKYTDDRGSVVLVTYGKGDKKVQFILNYNAFDVKVRLTEGGEQITVSSYGFVRLDH